jgi:hypothetical protein
MEIDFSPDGAINQSVIAFDDISQSRVESTTSRGSRQITFRETKKPAFLKLKLTRFDIAQINAFNLAEPFLVATIMGASIELAQLGTVIYMIAVVSFLLPMLLTQVILRIKTKRIVAFIICAVAPNVTLMKAWIYC